MLQSVSIDLKQHEQGARAILGIALCKDILNDPNGPEVWLEVIETSDAHAGVRASVPMWRFFGDIEQGRWIDAAKSMPLVVNVDKALILRFGRCACTRNITMKKGRFGTCSSSNSKL